MENPTLYIFRREADRCVFVPSRPFASLMVGMFSAGSLFMLYLSSIFFRHMSTVSADVWIGAIFVLVAGFSATLAAHAWRSRRTPLSIEAGGRVSYGERELCATGTVRAVRIARARGGEAGECQVALEVADGALVYLPSQYFGVYQQRKHARSFAAKLAETIGVPVTEPL